MLLCVCLLVCTLCVWMSVCSCAQCANVCVALILVFPLTIPPTSSPVPLYSSTMVTTSIYLLFIYLFFIIPFIQFLDFSTCLGPQILPHHLTHLSIHWSIHSLPLESGLLPLTLHHSHRLHLVLLPSSLPLSLSHSALCLALSGWAAPRWLRVCVHSGACRASPPLGLTTRFCLSPLNSAALPPLPPPLFLTIAPPFTVHTSLNSSCHLAAE